jgi:ribosome biogenesis GTPase A
MNFVEFRNRRKQNQNIKMLRFNKFNFSFQIRCYSSNISRKTVEQRQEKVSKVAIIGMPNSGKSTLINAIMNHRVSL